MDVAIIGGGVAGCYSAYRLALAHPEKQIALFELSDRCGGRLWSVRLDGVSGPPIEMGGMFFGKLQQNVCGLVKKLKLQHSEVNWMRKHHFLRTKYLDDLAYRDPSRVPFNLSPDELRRSPPVLLVHALNRIVPGVLDLWPLKQEPPASAEKTYERLMMLRHHGRPLYDWGFWNVLNDIVSNEAYELLTGTLGSAGIFRNSNAFDAIWNLLQELGETNFYKLDNGYQDLPRALWEACEELKNCECHLGHRLLSVASEEDGFLLHFSTDPGAKTLLADAVVLALPQRALQQVEIDDALLDDPQEFRKLRDDSVEPTPASKLFMIFDSPWWNRSAVGPSFLETADVSAAYTDLPIRQCYYFGRPYEAAPAVLMAAYADDIASSFWSGLISPRFPNIPCPAENPADARLLAASGPMVESAQRQLSSMHHDTQVPQPLGALYVDWNRAPYGGAWHTWAAQVHSWEVRPKIRRPSARPLFICGEAFAERHGWVEGAINSAEMTLRHLDVERPCWVDDNYVFERDGEGKMSNPVRELLIALGESMGLQRAYARNPEDIMRAFGLNAKQQSAMESGDPKKVQEAAEEDVSVAFIIVRYEE